MMAASGSSLRAALVVDLTWIAFGLWRVRRLMGRYHRTALEGYADEWFGIGRVVQVGAGGRWKHRRYMHTGSGFQRTPSFSHQRRTQLKV